MNSTLSQVHRIWKGEEGDEIASYIDLLETEPVRGITFLVSNKTLRKEMKRVIERSAVSNSMKAAVIAPYRRVTSTQFIELLPQLKIDGVELKRKILESFSSGNIYKEIDKAVRVLLEPKATNTSVVYLSAANVQRSEIIEDIGISNYDSIIRNFTSFNVLTKTSSSYSIVFTARMKDYDNMVLPLVNPLYFKIFPTGETTIIDEDGEEVTDNHDTESLEC